LQCAVTWPSQSLSMSAVQCTAMPASQTGTVREPPESVAYLPLETWLQFATLARSCCALGPPPGGGGGGGGGAPPVLTVILSKSGAQLPAVELPNCNVLPPLRTLIVVVIVPGVLKPPVGVKLRVLGAPPLTLSCALRAFPLA